MSSPTARTLAWCRERGYRAQVVEKWQPQSRRRIDLFGFIDLLYFDKYLGHTRLVGVQVTSSSNLAERVTKAKTECAEAATDWLNAGCRLEFHGWAKRGARGKRKVWTLRRLDEDGILIPDEAGSGDGDP